MKGLLMKDFYLLKNMKKLTLIVVMMCIGMLFLNLNPVFVISYSTLMMSMTSLSTISYDEFDKGYSFLFTLPVSRKQYVSEKYMFGLLAGIGTWGLITIFMLLIKLVKGQTDGLVVLETVVPLLFISLLFLAFMIPIQIKFGAEKGKIALLTTIGGVILIAFLIKSSMQNMNIGIDKIFAFFNGISTTSIFGILMIACCLVTYISYIIAVRMIEKKQY